MRLRTLLETGALGLRLLGGEQLLDRPLRGVMTTDLRDPSRYLRGGELVLTGLAWWRGPGDAEPFVRTLVAAGVAGLAAGEAEFGAVPEDVRLACARHGLPLLAVAEEVGFAEITEHVVRQVSAERAGDLAAVVERHRRLMSLDPAGGGPQAVLDLLGSDLDLRAWLLTATGRQLAVSGGEPLADDLGRRLAARHLAALRAGGPAPYHVADAYSLFAVGDADRRDGRGDDVRQTVLAAWLLAVRSDAREWPEARVELLAGVARLIAAERERRVAARAVRRRLAQEALALVERGAPPAEVAARLRLAGPAPGAPEPRWQVVAARLEWEAAGFDPGPAARELLEELLAEGTDAATEAGLDTDTGVGVSVAHDGGEAVALVPLSGRAQNARVPLLAETILPAPVRAALSGGLGDDGRLSLGVSTAVTGAAGLRGALQEARHARLVAAARPERVALAGQEALASHVLLLPFVPEDVRRAFTTRLLDPLRAYDRRHGAELVATLAAFLAADGSWKRCADALHVHVNTLRYRMGRIEHLTGRDLSRLADRLDFLLALRMS